MAASAQSFPRSVSFPRKCSLPCCAFCATSALHAYRYNDVAALKAKLESDPNIVAFMVEPIQVGTSGCSWQVGWRG